MCEAVEGNGDGGVMVDKSSVKIAEAAEYLDVVGRARGGPIRDGSELLRVHFDAIRTDEETEVLDLRFVKFTFGGVGEKAGVFEFIEDEFNTTQNRPRYSRRVS